MADYDSSLPVRTESAGDIDIFVSDATTPAQKLKVNADGSVDTNFAAGAAVEITDGTDTLAVNADGSINAVVTATQLDVDDLNATDDAVAAHIKDATGAAFSAANPLPVEVVQDALGDEIVDYNTSAAVAAAASVNHDYTVTIAKTLLMDTVFASGSGKIKVEVLVNAVAKYTGFNSTSNPNIEIPMKRLLKGLATEVVRITITNKDKQAQDVYSTLSGIEV